MNDQPQSAPQQPQASAPQSAGPQEPYLTLAQYGTYEQAQGLVDRLSDARFEVSALKIVGEGLRSEEHVTGRQTVARAGLRGAGSGLWLGLLLGFLFGLLAPLGGWLATMLWCLLLGALWGAILGAVGHALRGGRRDFRSVQTMRASSYAVTVLSSRHQEAVAVLNGAPPAR